MSVRLMVVGGFLGAGKTSTIARMASSLITKGHKVGIVTNDQSENLVDTNFLRSQGMAVVEVTKGCFCCNFDEFTLKLQSLSKSEMPDIILAEPVGSCTDLIATIFKPIMNDYTREFTMSPLTVLADPRRIKRFCAARKSGVMSEINYLFDKQLSEADIILVNKCDLLEAGEIEAITAFLKDAYPSAQVLCASALTGQGFDGWFDTVLGSVAKNKPSYEIDYDIYAKAEAALGWYNGFATVRAQGKGDINAYVSQLLESIRKVCAEKAYDIAHVKAYAVTGIDYAKASVTSLEEGARFNKEAEFDAESFNLILNARVESEPDALAAICKDAVMAVAAKQNLAVEGYKADCFAPSYPTPKHRMA